MASKIVLSFVTSDGDKNFSYNHANPSATTSNVKAFANVLIENGDIFINKPSEIKSAKIVTTTEEEYDLS